MARTRRRQRAPIEIRRRPTVTSLPLPWWRTAAEGVRHAATSPPDVRDEVRDRRRSWGARCGRRGGARPFDRHRLRQRGRRAFRSEHAPCPGPRRTSHAAALAARGLGPRRGGPAGRREVPRRGGCGRSSPALDARLGGAAAAASVIGPGRTRGERRVERWMVAATGVSTSPRVEARARRVAVDETRSGWRATARCGGTAVDRRRGPLLRHLLDGSRAANGSGWQSGDRRGSSKPTGSAAARSTRTGSAPCASSATTARSRTWPADPELHPVDRVGLLRRDRRRATAGPSEVVTDGEPDAVLVTARVAQRDRRLSAHRHRPRAASCSTIPLLVRRCALLQAPACS